MTLSFETLNFHIYHTGGGCTAWRKDSRDGSFCLVTDEGGTTLPDPTNPDEIVLVGFYNDLEDEGTSIPTGWGGLPFLLSMLTDDYPAQD
jgi:hypothetical protein